MKLSDVIRIGELHNLIVDLKPSFGLAVRNGKVWMFKRKNGTFRWIKPVQQKSKTKRRRRKKID